MQPFGSNLKRGFAGVDAGKKPLGRGVKRRRHGRLRGGTLTIDRGGLGPGDDLAQTEEHMLIAGQAVEARTFEDKCQSAHRQGSGSRASIGRRAGQLFELDRPIIVERALGLQVQLPTVAGNRPLHNLRGTLVDTGNADIALDLLDHILLGVAITTVGLDRVLGGLIATLGGKILHHGPFRLLVGVAAINPLSHPLNVGARRLQPNSVGDEQFVGVRLFR